MDYPRFFMDYPSAVSSFLMDYLPITWTTHPFETEARFSMDYPLGIQKLGLSTSLK
jgi:hypothetical protein